MHILKVFFFIIFCIFENLMKIQKMYFHFINCYDILLFKLLKFNFKKEGRFIMKEKINKFFQGRYGSDELHSLLMILFVILFLIYCITKSYIFNILSFCTIAYAIFRMLSKNIIKRQKENQKFLYYKNNISSWFKRTKSNLSKSSSFCIYLCPKCRQKVRVPKGKGKICIKCPKCSKEFTKRS